MVDAHGFPARPPLAAKVPAARIWGAGWSSSPLSVLRRVSLSPVGVPGLGGQLCPCRADLGQGPWADWRDSQHLASRWQQQCYQLLGITFPWRFSVDHIMAWLPLLPTLLTHAPFPGRVCFHKFNQFNLRPITMYNRIKNICLGKNLAKYVQDLYPQNLGTILKEIPDSLKNTEPCHAHEWEHPIL